MSRLMYILTGAFFGFVLYKSEVISWFRIQEMFRLDSFHMYGIIGSAISVGAVSITILRKIEARSAKGVPIKVSKKPFNNGTAWPVP